LNFFDLLRINRAIQSRTIGSEAWQGAAGSRDLDRWRRTLDEVAHEGLEIALSRGDMIIVHDERDSLSCTPCCSTGRDFIGQSNLRSNQS
jgi:hypothetical protein